MSNIQAKNIKANTAINEFVKLKNEYTKAWKTIKDEDARLEQMRKISDKVLKLKKQIITGYYDFVVDFLRKENFEDPTMIFLGSLQYQINDAITQKYFHQDYPDFWLIFDQLVPRSKRFRRLRSVFKKAYDKVYGQGVFEQLVKNNKKNRNSHKKIVAKLLDIAKDLT